MMTWGDPVILMLSSFAVSVTNYAIPYITGSSPLIIALAVVLTHLRH